VPAPTKLSRCTRHVRRSLTVAVLTLALAGGAALPADAHGYDRRWICLAHYESTHRWQYNGVHDGGLQFSPRTWTAYTGSSAPRYAWQASPRFQVTVAKRIAWYGFYNNEPQGGASAWPNTWNRCS
jgi:hypothetical protein